MLHSIPMHHAHHYLHKFLLECEFADDVLEVGGLIPKRFVTPEWEEAQRQYAHSAMARESGEDVRQPARVGSEDSVAGSGDELNVGFAEEQQSEASVRQQRAERVMGEKAKEHEEDTARQVPKKRKTREDASEEEKEEDAWRSEIRNKVRTSSKNRKNRETVILGLSHDRETELLRQFLERCGRFMAKSDMDGSCLFNSMQQQLYRPDMVKAFNMQEFHNMVAILTAEHWEMVFTEEVITSLQSEYGMTEEDRNQAAVSGQCPGGPYSMRTYLEALLDAKTWADLVCLNLISRLFLLRVSIIAAGEDMAIT